MYLFPLSEWLPNSQYLSEGRKSMKPEKETVAKYFRQ
jgi:hypothetical protein